MLFGCLGTNLIENKVVNAMIMPRRFRTSVTKYSTNIGIVVMRGAKIVQVTSAATDILASSYSARPNSSSFMESFYDLSTTHGLVRHTTYLEVTAKEAVVDPK